MEGEKKAAEAEERRREKAAAKADKAVRVSGHARLQSAARPTVSFAVSP